MASDKEDDWTVEVDHGQADCRELTCTRCGRETRLPDGYDPTPYCNNCAQTLVDHLKESLREAVAEIEEHNGDYHHQTSKEKIDRWKSLSAVPLSS